MTSHKTGDQMQIGPRLRSMTGPHWLAVFGLILGAWALLFAMAIPTDLRVAGRLYGAEFWASFCAVTPGIAGWATLVLMWAAMSAAMMAPSFLPTLATYEDITRSTGNRRGFYQLLIGYLSVWAGFSVIAATGQLALYRVGIVNPIGQSLVPWFTVLLLTVAGFYQFSTLKQACLAKCRAPFGFFLQHWSVAPWAALRMGTSLGVICLGCCWALMTLAFVGGLMNLLWMGLATLLMVLEKLPDIGRYITKPLGLVLIAAAGVNAIGAAGLF